MRTKKSWLAIVLTLAFCASLAFSTNAFAAGTNDTSELHVKNSISSTIYEMVASYENGTFDENKNDGTEARSVLSIAGMDADSNVSESDNEIKNLYAVEQLDETTYEAIQVTLYSAQLEQSMQGEKNGVVMFSSMVYEKETFGNRGSSYIKPIRIQGGVVRNASTYWCESMAIRYRICGDANTSDGTRIGWRDFSVNYNGANNNPQVGLTYYLNSPTDLYFNKGATGTAVVGFTRGKITFRMSSMQSELEVSCAV